MAYAPFIWWVSSAPNPCGDVFPFFQHVIIVQAIQSGDKVLVEILNDQRLFGELLFCMIQAEHAHHQNVVGWFALLLGRGEGSAVETANLNARLPEGQTALMLAAQIVSDDQSSSELGGSSCVEYLLYVFTHENLKLCQSSR